MIDFYYWPTPNGWKVAILLEELGLPYTMIPVRIGKGDQFNPEFLAISPNNRMPAIVDHDVPGDPVPIFESGAIMWYLAEKAGKFLPADPLGRTSADWIARLDAHDVPCAPVLTRREMTSHPQVVENGIIVETDHPQAGRLRQSRNPARFEGTPAEHRTGGPALGGNTRTVLAEIGYAPAEIDALIASGAAATEPKAEP